MRLHSCTGTETFLFALAVVSFRVMSVIRKRAVLNALKLRYLTVALRFLLACVCTK